MVLPRFEWIGIVLTTDTADGHGSEPNNDYPRTHALPVLEKHYLETTQTERKGPLRMWQNLSAHVAEPTVC